MDKCYNQDCSNHGVELNNNCRKYVDFAVCKEAVINKNLATFPEPSPCNAVEAVNPLDVQVGGDHYKSMAIQPIEFTHKNNLNFCQGNIIKYVTRYKNKNGLEDLKKVIHYTELLMELEYGSEK